jgi:NAD-dependent DNA ligase
MPTGEKAGSKLDKAKELGVPVLTEAQFVSRIGKAATERGEN